jgi:hypothetical protein
MILSPMNPTVMNGAAMGNKRIKPGFDERR